MIGSIKKMFGGDSYYLEIDESKSVTSETPAPAPVVEAKPEPVKVEAEQPEVAPTPAVEAKPEPVIEKKKEKKKAAAKVFQTEAPATVSPSASNPLELIKAAVQKPTSQNEMNGQGSEPTFATDYLLYTKTQAKRRPGACMSSFLDMARKRR